MSIGEELDRALADTGTSSGKRKWRWIWACVAIILAAGTYIWFSSRDEALPSEGSALVTATAAYRSIGDTVAASGKLRPVQVVDVGAQVSGQMQRLLVQAGDRVSKSDVVAEI